MVHEFIYNSEFRSSDKKKTNRNVNEKKIFKYKIKNFSEFIKRSRENIKTVLS